MEFDGLAAQDNENKIIYWNAIFNILKTDISDDLSSLFRVTKSSMKEHVTTIFLSRLSVFFFFFFGY